MLTQHIMVKKNIQYRKPYKQKEDQSKHTLSNILQDTESVYREFNLPDTTGKFSLPHSFRIPKDFYVSSIGYRVISNAREKHEFFRLYGDTRETEILHLYDVKDYVSGILLINGIPLDFTNKRFIDYNGHKYVESKELDISSIDVLHTPERTNTLNGGLFINAQGVINTTGDGIGILSKNVLKLSTGTYILSKNEIVSENYIKVDSSGKITQSGTVSIYNNKHIVISENISAYFIVFDFSSIFDNLYDTASESILNTKKTFFQNSINKYSEIFNNAYLYPNIDTVLDKPVTIGTTKYVPGYVERHIIQSKEDLPGYSISENECSFLTKNNKFLEPHQMHNPKLLIPVVNAKDRKILLFKDGVLFKSNPEIIYAGEAMYILVDISELYGWQYSDYHSTITRYINEKQNIVHSFDIKFIEKDAYVFEDVAKFPFECIFLPLKVFDYIKDISDIQNLDVYLDGKILDKSLYEVDFFAVTDTSNTVVQTPALYFKVGDQHSGKVTVVCRRSSYTITEFKKDSTSSTFLLPNCAEYPDIYYNDGTLVPYENIYEVFPGNFLVQGVDLPTTKLFVKYKKIVMTDVTVEDIDVSAFFNITHTTSKLDITPLLVSMKDTAKWLFLYTNNTGVTKTVSAYLTAVASKTPFKNGNFPATVNDIRSIFDITNPKNIQYVASLVYSFWCRSLVDTYFTTLYKESLHNVLDASGNRIQNKSVVIQDDTIIKNYNSFFNSIGYTMNVSEESFDFDKIAEAIYIFDPSMFDSLTYHHFEYGLLPEEWCTYIRKTKQMAESTQTNTVASKRTLSSLLSKNGVGNALVEMQV